jgi:DNA primase
MQIDYLQVFIHCGLDIEEKYGNNLCPFCEKFAFRIYYDGDNIRGHCHNCKFSGNPVTFYSQYKHISYNEALNELITAYGEGKIKLRECSDKEAIEKIRNDLYFLSLVRMYFAFYNDSRMNKKYYQNDSNIPQAIFSRIINGDIESTSKENWNKALVYLRSKIDIKKFLTDLANKEHYFHDQAYGIAKSQLYKFK